MRLASVFDWYTHVSLFRKVYASRGICLHESPQAQAGGLPHERGLKSACHTAEILVE
jgi:hypothetical protein